MSKDVATFFDEVKTASRILVCDLGYLGDTIHLIPALDCIRQALPHVRLDVMVADHVKAILELTPWVDTVLGYPRFPKRLPWYKDVVWMWRLWHEGYDAVINLNSSDRSVRFAWGTRAPLRLSRVPNRTKPTGFWTWANTHLVREPFDQDPVYVQRWKCLKQAGFPGAAPAFGITVPPTIQSKVDQLLAECSLTQGFFHLSPFTTEDGREVPPVILAELVERLRQQYPQRPWVVSCSPTEREQVKLKAFLALLKTPPEKVFNGNLSVLELTALIKRSVLHLGGDSGSLHIALIMGTPAVSWFYPYKGLIQWMPQGPQYRSLIGDKTPQGLLGVSAEALAEKVREVLVPSR